MSKVLREHIEKIISLTDQEFDYVLSHFCQKRFLKHQFLIQEGDTVNNDFFILNGLLKASYRNDENKEHILQFATENSWITDPQAYVNQTVATLNIQCLEDGNALSITLKNKEKLCNNLQKMDSFFRKKITKEHIVLQRRVLCLISNNAKNRYEDLLTQYPSLVQRIQQQVVYQHDNPNTILTGLSQRFVYVLSKFVLGDNEKLMLELKELNGSRKVILEDNLKKIVRTKRPS